VDPEHWQGIFTYCADNSFNRITIDGDTSTNDTYIGMANGASGVRAESEDDLRILCDELLKLSQDMAYKIVQDAEGGTKVARIQVRGAADEVDAELVARAIADSPLVKTALFGCDANWGRIMCAAGYSGAQFDAESVTLEIGGVRIFEKGMPVPGDMDALLEPVMAETDVLISVGLGAGSASAELLTSDLTKEYVAINADYRS
jgi:glutamate N-acetyltransferase/amino-acid N-acetyltransferase